MDLILIPLCILIVILGICIFDLRDKLREHQHDVDIRFSNIDHRVIKLMIKHYDLHSKYVKRNHDNSNNTLPFRRK